MIDHHVHRAARNHDRLLRRTLYAVPPALVVAASGDDNVRGSIVRALRADGHQVVVMKDAPELLTRLETLAHFGVDPLPDLILVDVNLSGCTTDRLLTALGQAAALSPYLLVAEQDDDALRQQATLHGALGVLRPPLEPRRLRTAVDAALGSLMNAPMH